jgi:alpha-amylase/alpha-mannosidase (GH57 family)
MMAPEKDSQQGWRRPLREALNWLAGELDRIYEREGGPLFGDPWSLLDRFGEVVSGSEDERERFAREAARAGDVGRALELLELQRHSLCMFTSCAWFFDDLAGLEGTYALRHAARAIELAGSDSGRLEAGLLERLSKATVNDDGFRDGAELYRARALSRVAVEPPDRPPADGAPG